MRHLCNIRRGVTDRRTDGRGGEWDERWNRQVQWVVELCLCEVAVDIVKIILSRFKVRCLRKRREFGCNLFFDVSSLI